MLTGHMNGVLRGLRRTALLQDSGLADEELLRRFTTRRDEAAFEFLVRRHGPMVLGVCRRVLRNLHDAEDAFQATFLVLARKAAHIARPVQVGNWLYGTAYRAALEAKAAAGRRRREKQVSQLPEPIAPASCDQLEWQPVLDQELCALPEKYRVAVVLCDLEGQTRKQAARQLGVPEGTLSGRLTIARRMLARRLARHGHVFTAAALGLTLARDALALPHSWLATSVKAAAVVAAGTMPSADVLPASVIGLAERVLQVMAGARGRCLALTLLVIGFLAGGAGLLAQQSRSTRGAETGPAVAAPVIERPALDEPKVAHLDVHGDPLPAEALARLGTVRFRSGRFVSWLAYTPDGKVLLSHGSAGDVSMWDAASGREAGRISGTQESPIHGAALSPDGKIVATFDGPDNRMAADRTIRLWDRISGKPLRELGKGPYGSTTFSPDGSTLAAVRHDGRAELWDVHAGRLLRDWKAHEHVTIIAWSVDDHQAWTACFTADGRTLITAHPLEGIRLWDVASGTRRGGLPGLPQPCGFALSPAGDLAAIATRPDRPTGPVTEEEFGRIHLLDVATGKEVRELAAAGEPPFGARLGIRSVVFSADGKRLAARGADGFVRVWDVASGKELRRWWPLVTMPRALSFSPDGNTLASTTGSAIRLFDVAGGAEVGPPLENWSFYTPVAFAQNDNTAITVGPSSIVLWDAATGRVRQRLEGHTGRATIRSFVVAGTTLFSWADDKALIAWDLGTGKELRRLTVGEDNLLLSGFAVSPDGKVLAAARQEKVVLFDSTSLKEVGQFTAHSPYVSGMAFAPDGQTLVTAGGDGVARVWEWKTGRQIREVPFLDGPAAPAKVIPPGPIGPGGRIFRFQLSPDGRFLAFGSQNRVIAIHEVATGREVRRLEQLPDALGTLAFSPDGRTLAWAGEADPTIHVVEVASGNERQRLTGHLGKICSLAFSGDGKRLLSGSQDTTGLVWNLAGPP